MAGSHLGTAAAPIALTISATQAALVNVFSLAGSPAGPAEIVLTINAGVILQQGLDQGVGWASGCHMTIVNNGTVAGVGGPGGAGGNARSSDLFDGGAAGQNGGDAITLRMPTAIDNTSGNVFGGGGGGGGGGASSLNNPPFGTSQIASGGGGGGGRGYNNASGGTAGVSSGVAGSNGTAGASTGAGGGGSGGTSIPAQGGGGGGGGGWGTNGTAGTAGSGEPNTTTGGGAGTAGKAVALNGNAITWLGGLNGTQVVGAVS